MSTEDDLDLVFKALANPVRRRICDELRLRPLTTKQLCLCVPELDRCTVMLHLGVLERAGWSSRSEGPQRSFISTRCDQALHALDRPYAEHAAAGCSNSKQNSGRPQSGTARP